MMQTANYNPTRPPKELKLFLIFKEMHNFCLTFCTSGWKLPINQYYHWYQMILRNFNGNLIVIGSASVEQWSMVIGWVLWLQLRLLQLEVLPLPLWRWRVKVSMGAWEGGTMQTSSDIPFHPQSNIWLLNPVTCQWRLRMSMKLGRELFLGERWTSAPASAPLGASFGTPCPC